MGNQEKQSTLNLTAIFSQQYLLKISTNYHYFMKAKLFLFDYFQQRPHLNYYLPSNPLKLQDIVSKSLAASGFRLLLNGIDLLKDKHDALFFEIHSKFAQKNNQKQKVYQFLEFWQKTDRNFRVFLDPSTQIQRESPKYNFSKNINLEIIKRKNSISQISINQKQNSKRISQSFPQRQLGMVKTQDQVKQSGENQNLKVEMRSCVRKSKKQQKKEEIGQQMQEQMRQQIIKDFFQAVNKIKNRRGGNNQKQVNQAVNKIINSFVNSLKQGKIPPDQIISMLNRQFGNELTQQTKAMINQIMQQYAKDPKKNMQKSMDALKRILLQLSVPKASKGSKQQIFDHSYTIKESLVPSTNVTCQQLNSKKSVFENVLVKKKLKILFQMYSLGTKNRKGLTFQQLHQEFKKMDLTRWMSFNQKYDTISKLGIDEVHSIFKRRCVRNILSFDKFLKAFRDIASQLFPHDISSATAYFQISPSQGYSCLSSNSKQNRLPVICKAKGSDQKGFQSPRVQKEGKKDILAKQKPSVVRSDRISSIKYPSLCNKKLKVYNSQNMSYSSNSKQVQVNKKGCVKLNTSS